MAWKPGPLPPSTWNWGGVVLKDTPRYSFLFADFKGDHAVILYGGPERRVEPDEIVMYDNSLELPPTRKGSSMDHHQDYDLHDYPDALPTSAGMAILTDALRKREVDPKLAAHAAWHTGGYLLSKWDTHEVGAAGESMTEEEAADILEQHGPAMMGHAPQDTNFPGPIAILVLAKVIIRLLDRLLPVLLVCAACLLFASAASAALPASTLPAFVPVDVAEPIPAPQLVKPVASGCPCLTGDTCQCDPSAGCQCGDSCTCDACPGKIAYRWCEPRSDGWILLYRNGQYIGGVYAGVYYERQPDGSGRRATCPAAVPFAAMPVQTQRAPTSRARTSRNC